MGDEEKPGTSEKKEEECPWCKYMKGGGCREPFEAWQACVDAVMGEDLDPTGRKEAVDKCSGVTQPLFECMMRNRDYYGPQLEGMGAPPADGSDDGGGGGGGAASGGGEGGSGKAPDAGPTQVHVSVAGGDAAAAAAAPS